MLSQLFINQSLAQRYWAAVSFIIVVFVVLGLLAINSLKTIAGSTNNLYNHPYTVSNAVRNIKYRITAINSEMKSIALSQNEESILTHIAIISEHEKSALKSFELIYQRFLGDLADVKLAENIFIEWRSNRENVINLVRRNNYKLVKSDVFAHNDSSMLHIEKSVDGLLNYANNKALVFLTAADEKRDQMITYFMLVIGLLSVAMILFAKYSIRNLAPPIKNISLALDQLAQGKLDFNWRKSKRGAEIGQIENSVYALKNATLQMSNHAQNISKGNYDIKIEDRSNNDVLSHSMAAMAKYLKETAYINNGLTGLNDAVRGDQLLNDLAHNILQFLCQYTKTQLGCFYIVKQKKINAIASYAFPFGETVNTDFDIGEGLVGEAALQKQTLSHKNMDENYLKIESALGVIPLNNTSVIPILWDDEVLLLIELGRTDELQDQQHKLIKVASLTIAAIVNTAMSRDHELMLLNVEKTDNKRKFNDNDSIRPN